MNNVLGTWSRKLNEFGAVRSRPISAVAAVCALLAVGTLAISRDRSRSDSASAAAPPAVVHPAAGAAGSGNSLLEWLSAPVLPVGRNLFCPPTPASARNDTSTAKSVELRTDGNKERWTSQVHLQSTLMGPAPTAVINGQVVREGDVVARGPGQRSGPDLRVRKIETRRVVVEREGIELEIPLE